MTAKTSIKNGNLKSVLETHLFEGGSFERWSSAKKNIFEALNAAPQIEIPSLNQCPRDSIVELKRRCSQVNFAIYQMTQPSEDLEKTVTDLVSFTSLFGLSLQEDHRSGGQNGVVALTPSAEESKKGYIPYTPRAINWHTDGYYNPAGSPIKSFLLHCHRPAESGGVNEVIDSEIAFMRMYEADPAMVAAFFHPQAMVIPENVEKNGSVRPPSVGPVFFFDESSGRLQMRYTARTRSIEWRDDPATRDASQWMREWLVSDEPYKLRIKLNAGQGILNNNVLHNRTEFFDDPASSKHRVMLRVRFHDRIGEN